MVPWHFAADSALAVLEFEAGCAEKGLSLVTCERVGEEVTAHLTAEDRVDVLAVRTGEIATLVGLEEQRLVTRETLVLSWSKTRLASLMTAETQID